MMINKNDETETRADDHQLLFRSVLNMDWIFVFI
jgi:hypothetical protein